MRGASWQQRVIAAAMFLALVAVLTVVSVRPATASAVSHTAFQVSGVVINEIAAANDTFIDNFGGTPDWIELRNATSSAVSLEGWSIADDGAPWVLPDVDLPAGAILVIFASGRDVDSPRLHTDFSLKRAGETVTLANPDGDLVDQITYPALDDDQAYGRGSDGGLGFLLNATPEAVNSELAPSSVQIITAGQTFLGSLQVVLGATTRPGEEVRFTTNGTAVTTGSPVYDGPFNVTTSTVVRSAVVGNGVVGPESSAGYIAISDSIADFSSDLPLVIVHSTGQVGEDTQDAIVSVINRAPNGRTTVFDTADYNGFAGLRIRGASSENFPKLQYKFELWGDRSGDEVDADLLGLGSESDWGLYAPGFFDRAMINNPFMYELGDRTGVLAPGYQFVELFIEDDASGTVGNGDYLGLYVLRESIKIGDERVNITKHTPTAAGADGGYILRYDWRDDCCENIRRTSFGSLLAIDAPKITDLTPSQFSYIDGWWSELETATQQSFAEADRYIDFDSLIDHWLLEILAMDIDVLRASHYFSKDAGGQLRGGPLWDYDRSMGGADRRIDAIEEAEAWKPNGDSGHSYQADMYEDLWSMPEVQARLRARWAELRSPGRPLHDGSISALIFALGDEIAEAYEREDARWGSLPEYGSRFGGLTGELEHMRDWLAARTSWLDDRFLSNAGPPTLNLPADGLQIESNVAVDFVVEADDSQAIVYRATGLPEGLSIDPASGRITGIVGFGDIYGTITAQITVTNSSGAATTGSLTITDPAFATEPASPIVLNEYNAVDAGKFLENAGRDTFFGLVGGNGGNWFELVTVEDDLDLRGWRFDVFSNNDDGDVRQTASLRLGDDVQLAGLRAGSIITVSESVTDDLSYDPGAGDWTINLQANNAQQGALWSNQTNFDTNHKRWRLVIRDSSGAIRSYVGGETEQYRSVDSRTVNSTQVMGLDEAPSMSATSYFSGSESTFGEPNVLADGSMQNFSELRPELYVRGDANCNGTIDLGDALLVAQAAVGSREDSSGCPLANSATQYNAAASDAQGDGRVDLGDALLVAQCAVGTTNDLCP